MISNDYSAKAYRNETSGLLEVLERFMSIASRDFHTVMPAIVQDVDYDACTVTAQPLIKTLKDYITGVEYETAPVQEIPIIFPSAVRGAARLSMPVTEGDVGLIVYAERETENFLNSDGVSVVDSDVFEGCSYNGNLAQIGFFPEVFSLSAARTFRSDAVVLEHTKAISSWEPSGRIIDKNDNSTITQAADGSITGQNLISTFTMDSTGIISYNNAVATHTVDPTGNITTTNGVCTESLTVAGVYTMTNTTASQIMTTDGSITVSSLTAKNIIHTNTLVTQTMSEVGAYSLVATSTMTFTATGAISLSASAITFTSAAAISIGNGTASMTAAASSIIITDGVASVTAAGGAVTIATAGQAITITNGVAVLTLNTSGTITLNGTTIKAL